MGCGSPLQNLQFVTFIPHSRTGLTLAGPSGLDGSWATSIEACSRRTALYASRFKTGQAPSLHIIFLLSSLSRFGVAAEEAICVPFRAMVAAVWRNGDAMASTA